MITKSLCTKIREDMNSECNDVNFISSKSETNVVLIPVNWNRNEIYIYVYCDVLFSDL